MATISVKRRSAWVDISGEYIMWACPGVIDLVSANRVIRAILHVDVLVAHSRAWVV
jgi:hypothetical protein